MGSASSAQEEVRTKGGHPGERSVVEARAWAWRMARIPGNTVQWIGVLGALGPVPLPTDGLQSKIGVSS